MNSEWYDLVSCEFYFMGTGSNWDCSWLFEGEKKKMFLASMIGILLSYQYWVGGTGWSHYTVIR